MKTKDGAKSERPSVLDVVALLTDLPAQRLARGQVGTIVEQLDDKTLLVEFSDDQGRALRARGPPGPALHPGGGLIIKGSAEGAGFGAAIAHSDVAPEEIRTRSAVSTSGAAGSFAFTTRT
jgi:hypothetical protein